MRVVGFTYNSVEVANSVFIMLYLRLLGVYVYERQIDMVSERPYLLSFGGENLSGVDARKRIEAELYLIGSLADAERMKEKQPGDEVQSIAIIKGDWWNEYSNQALFDIDIPCVFLSGAGSGTKKLLDQIINAWGKQQLLDKCEQEVFQEVADIYCKNDICRLTLQTRFFYVSSSKYDVILQKYNDIFSCLKGIWNEKECSWGDSRYVHLQAAIIGVAFDIDSYACKCKYPMPYTPDSCIRVCDSILAEAKGVLDNAILTLQGQIYTELLDEVLKGYDCYLNACSEYNAYAYFKNGLIIDKINASYEKAIRYYKNSVAIFPEYYRAWYAMGVCYYKLRKWEEAAAAFERVDRILQHKSAANCLRPLEIEYHFKSMRKLGEILADRVGNRVKAIEVYKRAENSWDMIERTTFCNIMFDDQNDILAAVRFMKNKLKIKPVYERLYTLYQLVGKEEESEKYYRLSVEEEK